MGEEEEEPQPTQSSPENSELAGESITRRTVELVSSLISLSHSIKVFAVKWQVIRTKLEELRNGLIAVENCNSGDDPALTDLIPAINETSGECESHARRCLDLSFSGKLLMQSDLDVVAARLDRHARTLARVHAAGRGSAIVVSRPSPDACRDDLRFYVGDLATRMRIGGASMRRAALSSLRDAVSGDDDRYAVVVAENDGVVSGLSDLLDSPEKEVREESARLVRDLTRFGPVRPVLAAAGVIAPLIRSLETGSEAAARSLVALTENSDNAWSVSAHGGVTAALKIAGAGGIAGADLVVPATEILKNLIGIVEIKRFMIEEGAITIFVNLIGSKDEVLIVNAVEFLQNVAAGDDSTRQLIVREGGVRSLVRILESKPTLSPKSIETSLRAIESLCFSSPNSITTLIGYGFVHQLLLLLRQGEPSVQEQALKITHKLCSSSASSEEAKKRIGDSGFMPELLRLLNAKSYEVRAMAAGALASIVAVPRNRKRFLEDDSNLGRLMQMLDPGEGNLGNRKLLLSTLMSLTSCNSGRKKIVSSGFVKNIEKLDDDDDARRLVRKLSAGRFRTMLTGLWHS